MFFLILYKTGIWASKDKNYRNIKIFLLGTFFYLIIHSYLYSKYVENSELLTKYRKYIYYLLVLDIIVTSVLYNLWPDKTNKKPKEKIVQYLKPTAIIAEPKDSEVHNNSIPVKTTLKPNNEKAMKNEKNISNINKYEMPIPTYKSSKEQIPIFQSQRIISELP